MSDFHQGNVAYSKPTEQTGAWHGFTSDRAVDGNTDAYQEQGSCAHPDTDSIAWWRVDLESLHRIYSVTLYNTNSSFG